ncbi:MAG: hypothetical protein IJX46_03410 [Clostridia bacterium]|nr:hypothetical protein [Clostridia bacterium]
MERSEKKIRSDKRLGLTFVSIAFIFYFFPGFALFELVPNIFTYIFLTIGLNKLSYINDSIYGARKQFQRMIIVGIGKMVAIFLTITTGNAEEQMSMIMLLVFVLSLVECLLLVPAYTKLFEGILYVGMRHESVAVFGAEHDRMKKNATDKIKSHTLRFVIIKNLALFLPETAAMSTSDAINPHKPEMYMFVDLFRGFGMIISLIFGIIWLVSILKYFSRLRKDTPFMDALWSKYETEIIPNEKLFIERKTGAALLFLGIGSLFALDFYIGDPGGNNGTNIIPDVVFAVCAICGLLVMRKYIPKKMLAISSGVCAIYGGVSILSSATHITYLQDHSSVGQISRDPDAFASWVGKLIPVAVIDAVAFVGMCAVIFWVLKYLIENHTGSYSLHATIDPKAKAAETHKMLKKYLIAFISGAAFAALGGIARVILMRLMDRTINESSWLIELLATGVFVAVFITALLRINEQIKEKYLYE